MTSEELSWLARLEFVPTTQEFTHTETICNLRLSRCYTIQRVESSTTRMVVVNVRSRSASASRVDRVRVAEMEGMVEMVCRADRASPVNKGLSGQKGLRGLREWPGLKALLDLRVQQGLLGHKGLRETSDHRAQQGLRAQLGLSGLRVTSDHRAQQDHKDLRECSSMPMCTTIRPKQL